MVIIEDMKARRLTYSPECGVGDGCHAVPVTNVSPYEKMALPECAVHVHYKKVASPERDKPRSLRKDGIAGMRGVRSLQEGGFAGTG